jgi:hypothetical protein
LPVESFTNANSVPSKFCTRVDLSSSFVDSVVLNEGSGDLLSFERTGTDFFCLPEPFTMVIQTSPSVLGGEIGGGGRGPRHGFGRKFVRVPTIFAASGQPFKFSVEQFTFDEDSSSSACASSSTVKPAWTADLMNSGVVGVVMSSSGSLSESSFCTQNFPSFGVSPFCLVIETVRYVSNMCTIGYVGLELY